MNALTLDDFDYELPSERIAHVPSERRDGSRLLVHDVAEDVTRHAAFTELPSFLASGDLLVLNATRVIPARLQARRSSGGSVELLFLEACGGGTWRALVRPARRLRVDEELAVEGSALRVRLVARGAEEDGTPERTWRVVLFMPEDSLERVAEAGDRTLEYLERHGRMPLPPYIERKDAHAIGGSVELGSLDKKRYQTVYARDPGAVAAPTAGLHFTEELLGTLREAGVRTATVTLHVGLGTFLPVATRNLDEHRMHSERYELSQATVDVIEETRARGGRIVAVGTTSVRVLETVAQERGRLEKAVGETRLFLRPGSRFHVVDDLITNFHLPRSTLLMLVSAFAGRERILGLYAEAIRREYRFFSYGDAMLLRGRGRKAAEAQP